MDFFLYLCTLIYVFMTIMPSRLSVFLWLFLLLGVFFSCRPQNSPNMQTSTETTVPSSPTNTDSLPPVVHSIPVLTALPDSLAALSWIHTSHRLGSTEKKRTLLHSFLQQSFSSSLVSGEELGVALSYNPIYRGPLSCWSAMCDPDVHSSVPESLSTLIPEGTTVIVETTYPDAQVPNSDLIPFHANDLGFSFSPAGHDAFLSALNETLMTLIARGSLPQITCIVVYPYRDNLFEE